MSNATDYCKSNCNNIIEAKNNVHSKHFSNTSRKVRQAALLSSKSPSVTSGVTIYGNSLSSGSQVNNIPQDNTKQQYYVRQSLGLLMKLRR